MRNDFPQITKEKGCEFRIPHSGFQIPRVPQTATKTWPTVNKLTFTAFSLFFVWLKPQPHGKQ